MPEKKSSLESERKPVWNSLEISRLVAACATPLLIFVFGLIVSIQTRNADYKWKTDEKQAVADREERAGAAAAKRLEADRIAALRRDAAQREEARKDAAAASLLAFQREQALLDRAADREARLRDETRREARRESILAQRRKTWDETRVRLRSVIEEMTDRGYDAFLCRDCPLEKRFPTEEEGRTFRNEFERVTSGMRAYEKFFSQKVVSTELELERIVSRWLKAMHDGRNGVGDSRELQYIADALGETYWKLEEAVRQDLALSE